jgi:hypothetical protein
MSHWSNPSLFLVRAQSSTDTLYYHQIQSAAGLTSRQNSSKLSRYSRKPRQSHQICTIASEKIENHSDLHKKIHATKISDPRSRRQALIKGLTLGPKASHLTRREPETIDELFHELEEYIKSDEDY